MQHSDSEMFDVLRRVGMAKSPDFSTENSARYVTHLDMQVTTGGENFSQGERQLVSRFLSEQRYHLTAGVTALDCPSAAPPDECLHSRRGDCLGRLCD